MTNKQIKIIKKYIRLAKRSQEIADSDKPKINRLTVHGGWSIGYREGYNSGILNLVDELLETENISVETLE